MRILQTIDLKKYYGTEPNITRALTPGHRVGGIRSSAGLDRR